MIGVVIWMLLSSLRICLLSVQFRHVNPDVKCPQAGTYGLFENIKNGLVSLNACTDDANAATATVESERRIFDVVCTSAIRCDFLLEVTIVELPPR